MRQTILIIILVLLSKLALSQDSIADQKTHIQYGGSFGHDFHVGFTFQLNDNKNLKNKIVEFGYSKIENIDKGYLNDKGKLKLTEFFNYLNFTGILYFTDRLNYGISIGDRIGFNSWTLVGINSIINTNFFYYKFVLRPEIGCNVPIRRYSLQILLGVDLPINSNNYELYNEPTFQLMTNFCFARRLMCWDRF
jgi:hypothetical protein